MVTGGILQGMMVTLRHLLDARNGARSGQYREGIEVVQSPREKGTFTVQYPEERLKVPERFRYFPMLLVDEETGRERCTSCGICAKVCPPQCIWIVRGTDEKGKPIPEPREFTIDASICMQCGYCAEYCPFDAIKMNHDYELATGEREHKLIWTKEDLLVSTAYYARIHPGDWSAEEEERRQKEEADRKKAEAKASAAPRPSRASDEPSPSP